MRGRGVEVSKTLFYIEFIILESSVNNKLINGYDPKQDGVFIDHLLFYTITIKENIFF